LSIAFEIMEKQPLSLALVYGTDEAKTIESLNAFLRANGIGETKRYFSQMAVKQHGIRTVTFIKFAVVPFGTKKTGMTMVADLPIQKYLTVQLDAESFEKFTDGEYKPDLENYLKAASLRIDFSKTLPFAEAIETGVFRMYMPVK
jgi:hypothetical protein